MEPVIVFVAAIMIPITYLVVNGIKKVKQREYLHKERLRAIDRTRVRAEGRAA